MVHEAVCVGLRGREDCFGIWRWRGEGFGEYRCHGVLGFDTPLVPVAYRSDLRDQEVVKRGDAGRTPTHDLETILAGCRQDGRKRDQAVGALRWRYFCQRCSTRANADLNRTLHGIDRSGHERAGVCLEGKCDALATGNPSRQPSTGREVDAFALRNCDEKTSAETAHASQALQYGYEHRRLLIRRTVR